MKVYSETTEIKITPNTTIKQLKDLLNKNEIFNVVKLVFGDGQILSPVVFQTDQYDNVNFLGYELNGSYIITSDNLNEYLNLMIWKRRDYGETQPSLSLFGKNKAELLEKYKQYVREHRDEEDYMKDEEFEETVKNLTLDDRGPELNSVYVTELMKLQ